MSSVVLDASALLALLQDELGGDLVRERIAHGAAISAVNYEEVLSVLCDRIPLETAAALVDELELDCVPFDRRQARVATSLKPLYPRGHVSQADRACLALALELGQPALTGDRKWRDAETGAIVELIR
jgi:ribonuclease VapC